MKDAHYWLLLYSLDLMDITLLHHKMYVDEILLSQYQIIFQGPVRQEKETNTFVPEEPRGGELHCQKGLLEILKTTAYCTVYATNGARNIPVSASLAVLEVKSAFLTVCEVWALGPSFQGDLQTKYKISTSQSSSCFQRSSNFIEFVVSQRL
jgi:hypothetical protein